MKIRNKILFYISTIVILIMAVAFTFIFILFSEYREEEFQQQQFDKIKTTIKLIEQFKDDSAEISYLLDEQDINDFYDEKLLIFDGNKQPIFESLDDLEIEQTEKILNQLSSNRNWIETTEGEYDLIGVYRLRNGVEYYGISKANDVYGHTKLNYLKTVLILIFLSITIIIILVSLYISKTIATPIIELEAKISNYKIDKENNAPIEINTTTIELINLTDRFNELLLKTEDAFKFQKHTINHISHQLKTPIAVLVTELEKTKKISEASEVKDAIQQQVIKAKSLGSIIDVLLEISKIESGQTVDFHEYRIDEVVFDCINELNIIYPDFVFNVNYSTANFDDKFLTKKINPTLIKQAFLNLLHNSIKYSAVNNSEVNFNLDNSSDLSIVFKNSGAPIIDAENKLMFKYFFRGENSKDKAGHGLGLILTKRIVEIHDAKIHYERENDMNVFSITF
ncbi:MAG TPA: HAMP domain-containing sensor histidine kinase [Brumimicrobium sp.]|nr:HAMP domain-containing sensor histidine kinase [Brumimicrobium sp.]